MTADDLPLPTLLSRLLIAFTIEFDNEAEHRLEHRTTVGAAAGTGRGPWLVSQAMWANFMQFVLSQVLLAFTLDFERESAVSLAIAANALRVLTAGGIRIRELPYLTGVSKEALSMAAGILTRLSCAETGPDPAASRGDQPRAAGSSWSGKSW